MAGKLTPEVQALALQGTLDTFSLPDVLRLLATTSKTGRLRIDGDRGLGSVWLAERSDGIYEQRVAVKLMHAGFYAEEHQRRFRAERQILARLGYRLPEVDR